MPLSTIAKRILMLVPVLVGVALVTFLLTLMIPGSPADSLLPVGATPEERAAFISELHLDDPAPQRFVAWSLHAIQGDFGTSIKRAEPAGGVVLRALANTVVLAGLALLFSLIGGIALGAAIASLSGRTSRTRRALGNALNAFAIALASVPSFWFGLVLLYIFVVELHLLPAGGVGPIVGSPSALEQARYLILPVIVTGVHPLAITARYSRALLLEVSQQDFVLMLRSRGFGPRRLLRHQLRNVLPGLVSLVGLQAGSLIGGALFAEQVFSRPGVGTALTEAIAGRDYPVIQVIVLTTGFLFATITLVVDLLMHALDLRLSAA